MRLFLVVWTLSWLLLGSCVAQADEETKPIILVHYLAEYCAAALTLAGDVEYTVAAEWLEGISDFDSDISDILYASLKLLVEGGDLAPDAIRTVAAECHEAYKTAEAE